MLDISSLSLPEKIGQMVMCGFQGTQPSSEIEELIGKFHVGGVIYFSRNVNDSQQISQLSQDLQHIAKKSSELPLLISIDQEGGMVARIVEGITLMPGNMALGATRDVQGVFEAAKISGKELRLLGINMNFAPSVDINNNPLNPVIGVRSYGEKADLVSEMGIAAFKGYQESGVAATIKHFPGHGDTDVDSHLDLPTILHDLGRLNQLELAPFRKAIEDGVDAIMTAHVVFPALGETNTPSTLSPKVISQLLRSQLNYNGVIVTDCMEMKAISDYFGTEEAAVAAVEAGVDIVLISHSFHRQVGAIEALVKAVESGRIPEARIDQSVERIIQLKRNRKMDQWMESWDEIKDMIGEEKGRSIAQGLSEKSITLIKDDTQQLPLNPQKKTYVLWTKVKVTSDIDEIFTQKDTLGGFLSSYITQMRERRIGTNPTEEEISDVLEESSNYEQVIVTSYNATFHPGQSKLIHRLMQREDVNLVVVALRNPFDLIQFSQVQTYLACYESRPLALQSVAKVLMGEIQAKGKLPVTISEQYPYGWYL
jgi:beta-N-acetylhexosaminidase